MGTTLVVSITFRAGQRHSEILEQDLGLFHCSPLREYLKDNYDVVPDEESHSYRCKFEYFDFEIARLKALGKLHEAEHKVKNIYTENEHHQVVKWEPSDPEGADDLRQIVEDFNSIQAIARYLATKRNGVDIRSTRINFEWVP